MKLGYHRYDYTANEIAAMIYRRTRKRIKPQSINDNRNGKRKNPGTIRLITDAVHALNKKHRGEFL